MAVLIENQQKQVEVTNDIIHLIHRAVEMSLESEGFDTPCEISIILVDDSRIREINNEQRNIDKATDVLSFPLVDMFEGEIQSNEGDFDMDTDLLLLGDIVISLETTVKQAEEYGHLFERELAFLTTHGVFHILGYDHADNEQEKSMIAKQEAVLEKMNLQRNEITT